MSLTHGIHHVAYRCKDAKQTVDFYRDVLEMDFTVAFAEDHVPSTGAYDPYMHVFLDAGNGNILAFFELPNQKDMGRDENTPQWVQHLAFKTGHIFATAAQLAKNGFTPLAISPNYYDDLEARFALDADLLDRLKAANILYDRDEHGEYFQLYGPNYGEGFFFEIVERRGGYRGYGAANAQFRIAAQKRALETNPAVRR